MPEADSLYALAILPDLQAAQDGLQVITEQSELAASSITLIRDPNWEIKTALALAELETAGKDLQAQRTVPADFKHVDTLLKGAGKEMVSAADSYASGVDDVSTTELQTAVTHLDNVRSLIVQANDELNAVKQKYGVGQ